MILRITLIGLAGGCGALSRYGLSAAVHTIFGRDMPWGTMVVNVVGCFLFGLVTGLFTERLSIPKDYEIIVLTGFMGAFTTFSTYMYETHRLIDQGYYLHALSNLAIQNFLGLAAVVGGLMLCKWLPGA